MPGEHLFARHNLTLQNSYLFCLFVPCPNPTTLCLTWNKNRVIHRISLKHLCSTQVSQSEKTMSSYPKRKFKVSQPLRILAFVLALPSIFSVCLSLFYLVMAFADKGGPVDHYWSCGFLISGIFILKTGVFAIPFVLLCCFLQAPWNDLDI